MRCVSLMKTSLVNDTHASALDPPEEDVYAHGYLNAAMSDHHDTHGK